MTAIAEIALDVVAAQIDAVASDIGVDAAKTGMLSSVAIIDAVVAAIVRNRIEPLVVDPVMISKAGAPLLGRTRSRRCGGRCCRSPAS